MERGSFLLLDTWLCFSLRPGDRGGCWTTIFGYPPPHGTTSYPQWPILDSIYYRICPIKRALRRGNERVCVYLLVKNGNMSFTSKNSILLTVDKQDPRSCPIHSP